jgi:hypothetical protein
MALTDLEISTAEPKEKTYKLYDGDGLYLLVTPAKGKWWRFKYDFGGKEGLRPFGSYPEVSLSKAREMREAAKELIAVGKDPADAFPGSDYYYSPQYIAQGDLIGKLAGYKRYQKDILRLWEEYHLSIHRNPKDLTEEGGREEAWLWLFERWTTGNAFGRPDPFSKSIELDREKDDWKAENGKYIYIKRLKLYQEHSKTGEVKPYDPRYLHDKDDDGEYEGQLCNQPEVEEFFKAIKVKLPDSLFEVEGGQGYFIRKGKKGGEKSGKTRRVKAKLTKEAWQAEAEKIWRKHPKWSSSQVAKEIVKQSGGNVDTIRKSIKKSPL